MAKIGLGKGISALIPEQEEELAFLGEGGQAADRSVPVRDVHTNPDQPRQSFDDESLQELAASVKRHGVIQPIIVEERKGGGYTIIAGERRYRASILAGLPDVPVIVKKYDPDRKLEISLIENIQREDLNPIDEATAYKRLMEISGVAQEELASRLGKSRSAVANAMRLLKLPEAMQDSLKAGTLTPGHARAILSALKAEDQQSLYKRILDKGLSVREAEQEAALLNEGTKPAAKVPKAEKPALGVELKEIEEKLIKRLGTKVELRGDNDKGKIEISYFTMDDLDRIVELLVPVEEGK